MMVHLFIPNAKDIYITVLASEVVYDGDARVSRAADVEIVYHPDGKSVT